MMDINKRYMFVYDGDRRRYDDDGRLIKNKCIFSAEVIKETKNFITVKYGGNLRWDKRNKSFTKQDLYGITNYLFKSEKHALAYHTHIDNKTEISLLHQLANELDQQTLWDAVEDWSGEDKRLLELIIMKNKMRR